MDEIPVKDRRLTLKAISFYAKQLRKKAKAMEDMGEDEAAKNLNLKADYYEHNVAEHFSEQRAMDFGATATERPREGATSPASSPSVAVVLRTQRPLFAALKKKRKPRGKKKGKAG